MRHNPKYKEIEESGRPAIILKFHLYTDGDFGINVDENNKGRSSGIKYDIEDYTIDFAEEYIITDPNDNRSKICSELRYILRRIYGDIRADFDHTGYIYNWFRDAMDNFGTEPDQTTYEFGLSGNYDGSYIRIILKNIIKFNILDSVYIVNMEESNPFHHICLDLDDCITRALILEQGITESYVRYVNQYDRLSDNYIENNSLFVTEEEAIAAAKKRIDNKINELSVEIEKLKAMSDDISVPDKINEIFEKYYEIAKKKFAKQEASGCLTNEDIRKSFNKI